MSRFALPGQPVSAAVVPKPDYSQEAAVIEEVTTKIAFENSGNYTREQSSRVQVKTDAGVKEWGLLSFPRSMFLHQLAHALILFGGEF